MSTHQEYRDCPKCDGKDRLDYCYDTQIGLNGGVIATCMNCGWETWVEEGFADLEEINELREMAGLRPLARLRQPKKQ